MPLKATENYPDFIENTGYGTGDGLGGWNRAIVDIHFIHLFQV